MLKSRGVEILISHNSRTVLVFAVHNIFIFAVINHPVKSDNIFVVCNKIIIDHIMIRVLRYFDIDSYIISFVP